MTTTVVIHGAGHAVQLTTTEGGRVVETRHLEKDFQAHSMHIWGGRTVTLEELPDDRAAHPGMAGAMDPNPQAPAASVGGVAEQLPVTR